MSSLTCTLLASNLKGKKWHFFIREVQYLRNRLSSVGIKVDPEKFEAVKKKPNPTKIKDVHDGSRQGGGGVATQTDNQVSS